MLETIPKRWNYVRLRAHKNADRQRSRVTSTCACARALHTSSCALSTPGEPAGQPTKGWAAPLLMPIRVREDFKPQSHAHGLTHFPGRSLAALRVTNERNCSVWISPRICGCAPAFDILLLLQLSNCKGGTES